MAVADGGLAAKGQLLLVCLVASSFVLDRTTGRLIRPDRAIQVAHPPNLHETRTSLELEFSYEFRTNSMGVRFRELPRTMRCFKVTVQGLV